MTDPGMSQAPARIGAPPQQQPVPAARPTSTAADSWAFAGQPSRAAAREAALTALSAARHTGHRPQWTTATTTTPPATAPPTAPSRPPTRPGRRRAGSRIGWPQVLCWQLVLVAFVLAVDRPWPVFGAVVVVAVVALASTSMRFRGRWLHEWLVVAAKYALRERDRDLRGAGEAGQALLRLVSPEAVGITDDVFLLSRAAGITVVLQPKSTAPDPETLLPPTHEQALGIAVQVVHHAGTNRARVWVALQALRTVEVNQDADVRRVLGNTVRRVQRQFRRDGQPARTLTEDEVLGALASLAHVTAGRTRIREEWRLWHSGPISQATFRLDGWTSLSPAVTPQLIRRLLTAAPQAAVTIAVTASRPAAATEPRIDATMRIATTNPLTTEQAANHLTHLARQWGLTPERLDGQHNQGLAATLPIGVAQC